MRISELFVTSGTAKYLRQLYNGKEADRRIRNLGTKRAKMTAMAAGVFLIIAIPVFASDHDRLTRPVTSLERNEYGMGARNITVRARTDGGYEEKLTIKIEERQYTERELERFSARLDDVLWTKILGDNTDADNVIYPLKLPERVEGFPFAVSWRTDMPRILSSKGMIDGEELKKTDPGNDGVHIQLCATVKYGDYEEDKYSHVTVRKLSLSGDESLEEGIYEAIRTCDEQSKNDKDLILPQNVGGKEIRFSPADINRGWVVLFTGVIAVFMSIAVNDSRIKDEAARRRTQIEEDYPRILNQYALYHTAGMNPRAIWNAICKRYEDRLSESGKNRRYAYDEMIRASRMMDEGGGELGAYDAFAARCESVGFRLFVSFVKQAVVKGNDGLDELLYDQIEKADHDRSARVKTAASEAETKLLLPMFMMLLVVLAYVMIPAFIGLNG